MIHFGGKSKVAASKSMSSGAAPGIELSQIECSVVGEPKTIFSKKFIESPAKDEKMFYHNKRITLYKTEMCRSFNEMGFCKYGDRCQFCHSKEELREVQRHPKYKTEICKTFWNDGSCPYGSRCCFVHLENLDLVSRVMDDHCKETSQTRLHRGEKKSRCSARGENRIHYSRARMPEYVSPREAGQGSAEYRRLLLGAVRKARKDTLRARTAAEQSCPDKDSEASNDFDTVAIAIAEEDPTSTTKACSNPCAVTSANRVGTLCNGAVQRSMAVETASMSTGRVCNAEQAELQEAHRDKHRTPPIEHKLKCMHSAVDILNLPRKGSFIGYLYNSTIEALIEARSFESDTLEPKMFPRLTMLEEIHFRGRQSIWERNYIARWKSDPIFFILQDIMDVY